MSTKRSGELTIERSTVARDAPQAPPLAPARFGRASIEIGKLVVPVEDAGAIGTALLALVNGIEIGRCDHVGNVNRGDRAEIACSYFPNVPLPAQIRFAGGNGESDIAPALSIRNVAEIELLVGPGHLEDTDLIVRNGAIEGSGINRINGLGRPHLVGRVNGHLLREVRIDAPRRRDEGGATLTFSLAIDPSDFTDSGASYEILALPDLTIIARVSFPRGDNDSLAAAINKAEAAVATIAKRLDLELARASEMAQRNTEQQREMLDSVVEYVVALVYDALAKSSPDETGSRVEAEGALKTYRELMANIAGGKTVSDRLDFGVARPDSSYFADGWSWLEQDSKGFDFRWMGLGGAVFNPNPQRPVEEISVAIGVTYQHRTPVLTAMLDDEPADTELISSPNGPPYSLKIRSRRRPKAHPVHVVRLTSATAGRPSEEEEGNPDNRILSIAVTGITFYYSG
jgi:hypothetical protein